MDKLKEFFLMPSQVTHKKYEALRALCVEKCKADEVARALGYSIHSIHAMKKECRECGLRILFRHPYTGKARRRREGKDPREDNQA
jgi:transposase